MPADSRHRADQRPPTGVTSPTAPSLCRPISGLTSAFSTTASSAEKRRSTPRPRQPRRRARATTPVARAGAGTTAACTPPSPSGRSPRPSASKWRPAWERVWAVPVCASWWPDRWPSIHLLPTEDSSACHSVRSLTDSARSAGVPAPPSARLGVLGNGLDQL